MRRSLIKSNKRKLPFCEEKSVRYECLGEVKKLNGLEFNFQSCSRMIQRLSGTVNVFIIYKYDRSSEVGVRAVDFKSIGCCFFASFPLNYLMPVVPYLI